MKFGKSNNEIGVRIIKSYFAFLPVKIDNEIRWLERVHVLGYYEVMGVLDIVYFNPVCFLKSKDDERQNRYKKSLYGGYTN